jgi:hypothetical protein
MRQTKEQSLMTDMTVARSILDQLGGARFVALTGAREFVGSHRQPDFQDRRQPEARQPSAPDAHAADLYSVTFFRIARRSKATSINMLEAVFSERTGLSTKIAAAGRQPDHFADLAPKKCGPSPTSKQFEPTAMAARPMVGGYHSCASNPPKNMPLGGV